MSTITVAKRPLGKILITHGGEVVFTDVNEVSCGQPYTHRERGPARIYPTGEIAYCKVGKPHREDGPAVIRQHNRRWYYINGYIVDTREFFLKYGVL